MQHPISDTLNSAVVANVLCINIKLWLSKDETVTIFCAYMVDFAGTITYHDKHGITNRYILNKYHNTVICYNK